VVGGWLRICAAILCDSYSHGWLVIAEKFEWSLSRFYHRGPYGKPSPRHRRTQPNAAVVQ